MEVKKKLNVYRVFLCQHFISTCKIGYVLCDWTKIVIVQ